MHVLIAGETWMTTRLEVKGFATYSTGAYAVGLTELVDGLRAHGHEVTHIPNHEAVESFPWELSDFEPYDVVVLSDISADTIKGNLQCDGNTPAPTGSGNSAKQKLGQCAGL